MSVCSDYRCICNDTQTCTQVEEIIDLQTPLQLVVPDGPDQTLVVDLLAVHLTRDDTESIIVSILGESKYWLTTSAEEMKERVLLAAKGVYWQQMLKQTQDPTFMLLIFVWHALYATDEAFDVLFEHILYLVGSGCLLRYPLTKFLTGTQGYGQVQRQRYLAHARATHHPVDARPLHHVAQRFS